MSGAAPYPPPLAIGPSWLEQVAGEEEGGAAPVGDMPFPGEGWPRLEAIDYVSKLILLIVLLLALPWLIGKLLSEPGRASRHAAGFAMGSPGMAGS